MTSKPTQSATNDKIYELVARVEDKVEKNRIEVKQDIVNAVATVAQNQGRLEAKFDNLEAGRLTRNEEAVTQLKIQLQRYEGVANTKEANITSRVAIIWAAVGAVFVAVVTATAYRLIVGGVK